MAKQSGKPQPGWLRRDGEFAQWLRRPRRPGPTLSPYIVDARPTQRPWWNRVIRSGHRLGY